MPRKTAKRYDTSMPGYVYIIRTPNGFRPYYIGSTTDTKGRFHLHKYAGALATLFSELCGFLQFSRMREAFIFEQALHRHVKAEGYYELGQLIEYFGGIWEEGELILERVDTVVQTAVNRKVLAKAARHFQRNGVTHRSMSELLREVLSVFDAIITQQGEEDIETAEEADAILKAMFKVSLNPGDRYLKSFLKNLEEQNVRVDNDEVKFSSIPKPVGRPRNWDDGDQERIRKAAEKALITPHMQALIEKRRKMDEGATDVAGE